LADPNHVSVSRRARAAGWVLIAAGIIGVIGGAVPFAHSAARILVREDLWRDAGIASHGGEAMWLSVEWVMLSSAAGTYLGGLLIAAGLGWMRGRPWAPAVTWAYVFGGIAVNVTDMLIFAFRARPSPMRTQMLLLDGVALAFPCAVALALFLRGRGSRGEGER
jgi:hypothetical protein